MSCQLSSCIRLAYEMSIFGHLVLVMYAHLEVFLIFVILFGSGQDWIMEQWENNFYISSIAGAANGSSLVVMSKGLHLFIPLKLIFK